MLQPSSDGLTDVSQEVGASAFVAQYSSSTSVDDRPHANLQSTKGFCEWTCVCFGCGIASQRDRGAPPSATQAPSRC